MQTEESFFLGCRAIVESYQFRSAIEFQSVLNDDDIKRLKNIKSLRVRGRQTKWNARRVKVLQCLLDCGASAVFFEVLATYKPRLLIDLMSFTPKSIVKKWAEQAKSLSCGDGGNLMYLVNKREWNTLLDPMLACGVNYQTESNKGNKLSHNYQLSAINDLFVNAQKGHEIYLQTQFLDRFLAFVSARNAENMTILQVALKNGHAHTAEQIVKSIIHDTPKNFVLDASATMTCDELLRKSKQCLNEVKFRLEELAEEKTNIFEKTQATIQCASETLKLWSLYEAGMDLFFGEPHLKIVEEAIEIFLGFADYPGTIVEDQAEWCRENWKEGERAFIIKVMQIVIIAPIEAFLKAVYGAKLHQSVKLNDAVVASECIAAGADVNLIERESEKSLIKLAIDLLHERVAEILLDNGAKVGKVNHYQPTSTLLITVIKKGSSKIVDAILRNYDEVGRHLFVDHSAAENYAPIDIAANLGFFDIVKILLSLIDSLFVSVSKGDAECLQLIKSLPRDEFLAVCNACDEEGYNLAQVARIHKHDNLAKEIFELVRDADK